MKEKTGMFTKVFIGESKAIVFSFCLVKECNALYLHRDNFEDGVKTHLPEYERINQYTYIMPTYQKLTKKKFPQAFKQYTLIQQAFDMYMGAYRFETKNHYTIPSLYKIANYIEEKDKNLGEAFNCLVDVATNAGGNIRLDLEINNVAVNANGNLVLLDLFFNADTMYDNVFSAKEYKNRIGKTITRVLKDLSLSKE